MKRLRSTKQFYIVTHVFMCIYPDPDVYMSKMLEYLRWLCISSLTLQNLVSDNKMDFQIFPKIDSILKTFFVKLKTPGREIPEINDNILYSIQGMDYLCLHIYFLNLTLGWNEKFKYPNKIFKSFFLVFLRIGYLNAACFSIEAYIHIHTHLLHS